MTRWAWAVGAWTGLPTWQLTRATNRNVTFRLSGRSEATFALDGTSRDATQIRELITDVWVYRDGHPLYRGRVGGTSDSNDGDKHAVAVSSADYRAVLDRRLMYEGDTFTYTGVDQSQIAWNLISTTQARGSLGIVRGAGQTTGVLRDRTYEPGNTVGKYLDQLSEVHDAFDYDISPSDTTALTFDVFYPRRGTDRQFVLDFPGAVRTFRRTVDPGQYANSIRVSGDAALTPARADAADIGTREEGRWDSQVGDTTILNAATLTARAQAELDNAQAITPSWQVEMQPDAWGGPNQVWLGDPVILAVKSGRLNVVESLRVQEIHLDFSDEDTVTATLTLGQVPPDRRYLLRTVNQRLTALERR